MSKLKKIKEILDKKVGNEKIVKQVLQIDSFKDELNNLAKSIEDKEQLTSKDLSYIENAIQSLIEKEYPEPYKEVKIENLDEINIPEPKDKIEVKNLEKTTKGLSNRLIEAMRDVGQYIVKQGERIFVTNSKEQDYIPVRVVYKDGKRISFDPPWGGGVVSGGGATIPDLNRSVSAHVETLGTTAKQVAFSGGDITIPANTTTITVENGDSDNTVYIGGSTVASDGSNGFALYNQGDTYSWNKIGSDFNLYIVASAASTTTRILYS